LTQSAKVLLIADTVLLCPKLSVFKSKYLKRSTAHYLQATDNKWKETYPLDNAFSEKQFLTWEAAAQLSRVAGSGRHFYVKVNGYKNPPWDLKINL